MKSFALIAATLCMTACPAYASEVIEIAGTGDGTIVLQAIAHAFEAENPGVEIRIPESIGSSGGIKAVGTGKVKVGRVARSLKSDEAPYGLTHLPFAKVPVVFFVHPGVGRLSLTSEQVVRIYAGTIRNWSEVGGPDLPLRVVRREDGDSSLQVLRSSFPGFGSLSITEKSKQALSTPEAFSAVEETPGAIGFGPYDVALASRVTAVVIDGAEPGGPEHPCFTPLALVYKEENRTGTLARFLSFVKGPTAAGTVRGAGGVPL